MIEEIDEPIKVVAAFQCGKIIPLVFSWRNRRYEHLQTVSTWSDHEGEAKRMFFGIAAGPNFYELCFHTGNFQWKLVKIHRE